MLDTFYLFYIPVAANSRLGLRYKEVQRGNDQEGAVQSRLGPDLGTKPKIWQAADRKDEEGIPWVLPKVKIKQHCILPKTNHQKEKGHQN